MQKPSIHFSDKHWYLLYTIIAVLGLVFSFCILGSYFKDIRATERFVTVKGLSEKDVRADIGTWVLSFNATGDDLQFLQTKIEEDKEKVITFLTQEGFNQDHISVESIEVVDLLAREYREEKVEQNRFIIHANIKLRTPLVDKIQTTRGKLGELVKQGVLVSGNTPTFLFTRLNDVKPEMIADATRNARQAAAQFAKDSDSHLGKIRRAYQGVFAILPQDYTEYGESESSQINKKVRIVSTIDYFLED